MSRGPGRCQRAVLRVLEASEGGAMGLGKLAEVLEAEGFRRPNVYRALRGLARGHHVHLYERGPGLAGSRLSLPQPSDLVPEAEIFRIIEELAS